MIGTSRKATAWVLSLALLAGLGLGRSAEAAVTEFAEEGKPPPLFALKDEFGKTHQLAKLLGKPTIIYFTHNQCHYCTQVIAFLKRAHEAYSNQGLTIVTINVWANGDGGAELIRRYREQFGLPFRMLAGKNNSLLREYEVNYVPILIFVGRDGLIRRIFHHYILPNDFKAVVKEIVEGD